MSRKSKFPCPSPQKKVSPAESLATISNVLLSAFIIATLYFGRELLVPLALAALLTFMLAPLVTRLEHRLGRGSSLLLVVITMCAATGGAGWVLTRQAVDLANQLPNYKENIRTKLKSIQVPDDGPFSKFSHTLEELKKDFPGSGDPESLLKVDSTASVDKEPMPVQVVSGTDQRLEFVIQARYLTSKLRANFPHLRIIVGMWGRSAKDSEAFRILKDSGADDIVTSVTHALEKVALAAPFSIVAGKKEMPA